MWCDVCVDRCLDAAAAAAADDDGDAQCTAPVYDITHQLVPLPDVSSDYSYLDWKRRKLTKTSLLTLTYQLNSVSKFLTFK